MWIHHIGGTLFCSAFLSSSAQLFVRIFENCLSYSWQKGLPALGGMFILLLAYNIKDSRSEDGQLLPLAEF